MRGLKIIVPKAVLLGLVLIASLVVGTPHVAHAVSPPIAAFSWAPCEFCGVVGSFFFFNAAASLATSGSILLYTWNFGDGTPSVETTNPFTSHDYLLGCAKCLVTLTVQDSNGLSDTISHAILFDTVPVISFQPVSPTVNSPVTFNGTGSKAYNPSNPILAYSWSFGDGTTANGKIAIHTYSTPGPYRIILSLQTIEGNPSASTTIKVSALTPITLVKTTFSGVNVTASSTLTINATAKTLVGLVSVTVVNATTGAVIVSKTFNIALSFGSSTSIKLILKIQITPIALGVDCAVNAVTSSASCKVTRNPDVSGSGYVSFLDFSTLAFAYGSTIGSPRYNAAVDLDANGAVDFIDVSIMAFYYGAVVLS